MKVLFLTDLKGNSGSTNANRSIVHHWPKCDEVEIISSINPLVGLTESIVKSKKSDVVISAGTRWFEMIAHQVMRYCKKPFVCFNHGYAPFENEVNKLGYSKIKISAIKHHLATADLIIANSHSQASFIVSMQPELDGKVAWSTLGVDSFFLEERSSYMHGQYVIATAGGTRYIKGNDVVIKAVSRLREKGISCKLEVYGEANHEVVQKQESELGCNVDYKGQLSHDLFLQSLRNVDLFVMNSRHESFGLSAVDALTQGCSLLVSSNCGMKEVMQFEDSDIILNCEDYHEVERKIENTLANPNSNRLYNSIDFDEVSWEKCSWRIREMCQDMVEHNNESKKFG